jgi:protein-S-isoprenylcysteine O-methyltransferase Ste14
MMKRFLGGLARWLVFTVALCLLIFFASGRGGPPVLWAYAAILSGITLVAIFAMDPDLLQERRRPGPGGIDRRRAPWLGLLFVGHLLVGIFDAGRFHWSSGIQLSARITGLALLAAGLSLVVAAAAANPFFSPVVRIQAERGHRLVTAGPYRVVRHPGYLGMVLAFPGSALALGSYPSLALAAIAVALILRRASLEDRYLKENLAGYRDYAARVRWRLIPGVW